MRGFGWAAALLLTVGASAAHAYDRLYVFGDSLVDSGNAQRLAPGEAPPTLYPSGRFTNGISGRNFADYLGEALGLGDAAPAVNPTVVNGVHTLGPGTNFAVGGATAAFTDGETRPDLLTEIQGLPATGADNTQPYPYFYTAAAASGAVAPIDADSLVLLSAGGNDVRDYVAGTDIATFVAGVDKAIRDSLDALYTLGARNFVLVGVPDIGLIPEVNGNPARAAGASYLSALLNTSYRGIADDYTSALAGQGIFRLVDIATLQRDITNNPTAYGLSAITIGKSCLRDGGATAIATNCAGYAYYDTIHPTTAVHRLIANAIIAEVPEPASWLLMMVGFGLTGAALRRARREAIAA